ncbi:MAG: ATP-dependent helicase UvrD/PcrA [Actinomycetota bacterium]|nr:ATP-dependent helicase UvrD/PcrA [Actinomycetota bacterium]
MVNSPEGLLASLDEQQRQAAEALLGPVVLLAGAGTGKTRAITHRIAYGVATGVYSPSRVMALTFTARSAGELRSRLRALGAGGVAARTFHASALSQLGFFWPQVVGGSAPKLLESKGRVIGHAAESLRLKLDTVTLRDTAAEIEWRKLSRMSLDQYAAAKRPLPPSLTLEKVVDLQRAYETVKDERKQFDFEDVLLVTAGMIESEPRVAQQVREQYRFFVVDEYQDVSPLQQELLSQWLGERNDLCVVGDASQTIYTFAGATPDYLLGFTSLYEDATVVRLEQNYRSTPAIVDAANRVMHGRAGALELHAVPGAPAGPAPAVSAFADDRAEARAIASAIRADIEGGAPPESIAILYRINVQSAVLEAALGDAGVPSLIRGSTRFFDQKEVKEALMLLKGASVNTRPEPLFQTVSDVLRSLGWTQDAPEVRGAVRDRWESLNALMGLADEAPADTTLKEFVAELGERQAGQHEPTMSAVTLATLHSAKGLEWDSVYIAGASEGLLPIGYARTEQAVEEERRLFYVGITRARRKLRLSWAGPNREPSRFLADLR